MRWSAVVVDEDEILSAVWLGGHVRAIFLLEGLGQSEAF